MLTEVYMKVLLTSIPACLMLLTRISIGGVHSVYCFTSLLKHMREHGTSCTLLHLLTWLFLLVRARSSTFRN